MKNSLAVGVVLIVLGAAVLGWRQFSYTTTEQVFQIGPIVATAEKEHTINFPAILGWLLVAGGVGVILVGRRK
jgi:hypothetical protein